MLRTVRRALGRIFKKREQHQEVYEPDPVRLAEQLSGVPGASPVWCSSCGHVLSPIVLGDSEQTEIVAVACLDCGGAVPVRAGLLSADEAPRPTIH